MLRLIVEVDAQGEDGSPGVYRTFDLTSPELEEFLATTGTRNLLGYELRKDLLQKDAPPEPGSLADRLAKLKAVKAGQGGENGDKPKGFAKFEERAKRAKEKEAAQRKKQEEAQKAKGYADNRRGWFGMRRRGTK